MHTTALFIFPHQLFETCPLLSAYPPGTATVYLFEEFLFFRQYNFHAQKRILHRASMQWYAAYLKEKGYTVVYIDTTQLLTAGAFEQYVQTLPIATVAYSEVVDTWLEKKIRRSVQKKGGTCIIYPTPAFLTSTEELETYTRTQKRPYFMKHFYTWQRKRLGILLTKEGAPEGGSWSFDTENRKRIPKSITLPVLPQWSESPYAVEARAYVTQYFPDAPGNKETCIYATTPAEARERLTYFIHHGLGSFGPYEDAIDQRSHTLFHSVLSPYLNNGLLQPQEVLSAVYEHREVPLQSLEGFIRQIIGWREYMRFVYETKGTAIRTQNYFGSTRKLAPSFWTGTTGIEPVDHTIHTVLKYAYTHHIPRLMIMGNIMNLCGIHPDEVYRWFMELYIDAYDWVMVPNVYSMALYADGGMITTKPYISGSRYILSMSDYATGTWATEWDALYWNFIGAQYEKLSQTQRMHMMLALYKRMSEDKKHYYTDQANAVIARLTV